MVASQQGSSACLIKRCLEGSLAFNMACAERAAVYQSILKSCSRYSTCMQTKQYTPKPPSFLDRERKRKAKKAWNFLKIITPIWWQSFYYLNLIEFHGLFSDFLIVDMSALWWISLWVSLGLSVGLFFRKRSLINSGENVKRMGVGQFLIAWLWLMAITLPIVSCINRYMDKSSAIDYQVKILEKTIRSVGRSTRKSSCLSTEGWNQDESSNYFCVSSSFFKRVAPEDLLVVTQRTGFFHIRWVEKIRKADSL